MQITLLFKRKENYSSRQPITQGFRLASLIKWPLFDRYAHLAD